MYIKNFQDYSRLSTPVPITDQCWGDGVEPFVSIFCLTFNHVHFIRDAIEGFLIQRTTFSVEILVHDDASTDGTLEIVQEYEKRYPKLIFPIYQKENQYSKGIDPFTKFLIPRARGKYISVCEGDDWWIDPLKLQKQVNVFDAYPDTIICGARAKTWNENRKEFTVVKPALDKDIACMTPEHFFYLGDWVKNCTRMIPRGLMLSIPSEFSRDYRHVHYLLAKNPTGFFRCLDEIVAVYREHAGGVFSGADPIDLLLYDFESKILLADLFLDERSHNMKDRAAEIAHRLAFITSLSIEKRIYYARQYFVLLYGDLSFSGIKRIFMKVFAPLLVYIRKYPALRSFLTLIRRL